MGSARPLSPGSREQGRRSFDCESGPERAFLRLWWQGTFGRNHGTSRHEAPVLGYGTGRSVENAKRGNARCSDFVKLWHRALAAATATNIHMDGPGKFYITGPNARFIDLGLLGMALQEMVKMTPLQGSLFEVDALFMN